MKSKTVNSYAKINLHLNILEKRIDGFHNLTSIFHLVDLCDHITVTIWEEKGRNISIEGMESISLQSNIMYKAASAFMEAIHTDMSIAIKIDKNIPMQGGLGGGSSNAATILDTLNELANYPLSFEQLYSIGLSLGSDVPFFLFHYPVALVEGRGEIVTKIESRNDLRAILVIPTNLGISTPEAFASLDHERLKNQAIVHTTTNANLCQMYAKPVASWSYFNDFSSILHKYNELYENLANFSSQVENCFGEVSGSGSTYYFLSDNDEINQLLPVLNERFQTQVTNICVKCLHRW